MRFNKQSIDTISDAGITFCKKYWVVIARVSLFLIFFWFGLIKLLGLSPASPLAEALTEKTIGRQYFDVMFVLLALIEVIIGLLFLMPRFTRLAIVLLLIHMAIVCSPLVLVPEYTWQQFGVPTLEGQYIIKNAVVIAAAIAIGSTLTLKNPKKL